MSLYLEAASILTSPTGGSLKSRIFHRTPSQPPLKSPPTRLYALIAETLKHQPLLNEVISRSGILATSPKLTHALALLLLHDHLLTRNGIATSTGPLKTAILSHKARISAEFTRARIRRGFATVAQLKEAVAKEYAPKIPRWVRVNTLRSSVGDVISQGFPGFERVETLDQVMSGGRVYYVDPLISNLLAFPPQGGVDLTTTPLYATGSLILQDRSSCLPAHLLSPPQGAKCVDATAAPGNKTTHLAALGGTVVAFEKDVKRAEVLKKMVSRAGGGGAITVRAGEDFLRADTNSEELRGATHLMLDPSCSGSGIVNRQEFTLTPLPTPTPTPAAGKKRKRTKPAVAAAQTTVVVVEDDNEEQEQSPEETAKSRLHSLAEFQRSMILHAMTFPSARRITYSTCSVHAEENEDVVVAVLASDVAKRRGWRVLRRDEGSLEAWPRRGLVERCGGDEVVAEACVRCNPVEDGGIGFFVVGFVRDGSIDEEEEEWTGFGEEGKGKQEKKKKQKKRQKK